MFGAQGSDGGNVIINGETLVLLDGSTITAQANQGVGGRIAVNTKVFLHDGASVDDVLNASSRTEGNDGTVEINAPETDVVGRIALSPAPYLDATAFLRQRCGAIQGTSSLVVDARNGLPLGPDDYLTSFAFGNAETGKNTDHSARSD